MFEIAELGRKVNKDEYEAAEAELRVRLLTAQRALRTSGKQVIVVVSGVEGAGKSGVVNRLNEWLDARGVQTHSFWAETDSERERPHYWRFWRRMPPRGSIGVMFGSWYTQPIIDRAYEKIGEDSFEMELRRIVEFERLLTADCAVIVKLWFHIDKKLQKKRIKQAQRAEKSGRDSKGKKVKGRASKRVRVSPMAATFSDKYDDFAKVSEQAIRATDTAKSRWYVVESSDANYRDISVGQILATALERALGTTAEASNGDTAGDNGEIGDTAALGEDGNGSSLANHHARVTVLDRVDLSSALPRDQYKVRLAEAQDRLYELMWRAHEQRRACVLVFEGWDAAGKGGAIRRVIGAMDARLYRVIPIAAPTDEERAQHYLWRFWRHLPKDGRVRVYDRSWYGRVLVERVEGFAPESDWRRAYHEINTFEQQLHRHGVIVCKFWLHISPEEQLRRFQEREKIAWKKHKITDEDWRNRERWDDYKLAINDMVARTSTSWAPWTLVAANDKKFARVQVVETVADRIDKALAK